MDVWYLDTSAVAKLVQPEAETRALRSWLGGRRWVISNLHRTELRRAARRVGARTLARAERLLAEADLLSVTGQIFDDAGRADPTELRSLDALHLAAAQALGPDLAGVVAYDARLLDAARQTNIPTVAPGTGPNAGP